LIVSHSQVGVSQRDMICVREPMNQRQLFGVLPLMREYVWLECTECGARNYRAEKETRGADRLERKKFCPKERKHTPHKESRKK